MKAELVITADGSPTLFIPEWNEHYHSVHGAVQESLHVFIQAGLQECLKGNDQIRLLEVGLGTGFNALLTAEYLRTHQATVDYYALEPFPPEPTLLEHFTEKHLAPLGDSSVLFTALHTAGWETPVLLTHNLTLTKMQCTLSDFIAPMAFDLVYYDAFAPRVQPELWSLETFQKIHSIMSKNGKLVTYCAKGDVRRALLAAGFSVERLQGPPGKREMLRATKL